MKINDYIKFLNEDRIGFDHLDDDTDDYLDNLDEEEEEEEEDEDFKNLDHLEELRRRGDDYAYLNDELDKINKKHASNNRGIDDPYDDQYLLYDTYEEEEEESRFKRTGGYKIYKDQGEEVDEEQEAATAELIALLHKMFSRDIEVDIVGTSDEIIMLFPMKYYGTLTYIIKIFETLNKLVKDVLNEYTSDVDMIYKKGRNILEITFTLDDDTKWDYPIDQHKSVYPTSNNGKNGVTWNNFDGRNFGRKPF